MKTLEELRNTPRLVIGRTSQDGFWGEVHMLKWSGSVVCTNGAGWEHVSVSPFSLHTIPSWEDMCCIKDMFWHEDEAVIQIHPPKDDYVNMVKNCLHLWRCTYREMVLPPSILVGFRKGQTIFDIRKEVKEAYEIVERYRQ